MIESTGMDTSCAEMECKPKGCELVEGNISKKIQIDKHTKACEIRADIKVDRKRTVRLWGQIKDCNGKPVRCALVKLIKEVKKGCRTEYEGIAHGITDCLGFYQFDICIPEDDSISKFRVLATKQATGKEMIIMESLCKPCDDHCTCAK